MVIAAQTLAPTVQSGNSGLLEKFGIESLTCPSKPDTARSAQLTSTGSGCSHQPDHPSQEFQYRAPACLELGLSPSRVQRSGS